MFLIKSYILCLVVIIVLSEKCRTPNGEEADCVPIRTCPILHDALTTLQHESFEFIKESQCGFENDDALVCCGSSASYIIKSTVGDNEINLPPKRRYCDSDFVENMEISTNLFPWFAILAYNYENGSSAFKCAGSLINNRYVLTAARCFAGNAVISVRLGRQSINQKEDGRFDFDECADYEIEKTTIHPKYRPFLVQFDIALLRLSTTVIYTDFMPGIEGIVYGWGESYLEVQTSVKRKMSVELLPLESCKELYDDFRGVNTNEDSTCSTIETSSSRDISCVGDSGGPIMFANKLQWHLEGIISFGKGCGPDNPSVNTRVASHLDWIIANIRP